MRTTRRSGRTPSIALLSKLTLGRNLRRWRGNWSDKSSSKYATLQASLPPLLTNWPMLRGLTGRFVSQLVSAILNKPTLRSTLVFSNYYVSKVTWSLPTQDEYMTRDTPVWLPSMCTPSLHRKMNLAELLADQEAEQHLFPKDWSRIGWCGWYTVPG